MITVEMISKVADAYDLSPEQARELLTRMQDQEIVPGTTTPAPIPQTEEEAIEAEDDYTIIYGIRYDNADGTITQEQQLGLQSLLAATGQSGQDVIDAALESAGKSDISELSATEAQILTGALSKAAADPATLWKWSFIQQISDPWHWLLVLGFGLPAAKKIGIKLGERWAARVIAKSMERVGTQLGKEILARQTAAGVTQLERTGAERLTANLATAAQERAAQQAAESLAATSARSVGQTTAERAAQYAVEREAIRAATQRSLAAATTEAERSAAAAAGRRAVERLASQYGEVVSTGTGGKVLGSANPLLSIGTHITPKISSGARALAPYIQRAARAGAQQLGRAAEAVGPLMIAALPFEIAYGIGRSQTQQPGEYWTQATQGGNAPYYEPNPLTYAIGQGIQEGAKYDPVTGLTLQYDPYQSPWGQTLGPIAAGAYGALSGLVNYPFQRVNQYVPPWGGYQPGMSGVYLPGTFEPGVQHDKEELTAKKISDEYELSPEQAKEILDKAIRNDLAEKFKAGDITLRELYERAAKRLGNKAGTGTKQAYPYPYPSPSPQPTMNPETAKMWELYRQYNKIEPWVAATLTAAGIGGGAAAASPIAPTALAYATLQQQIRNQMARVAGNYRPGWGGYQGGGGGAFNMNQGRGLHIPGITEPWVGV